MSTRSRLFSGENGLGEGTSPNLSFVIYASAEIARNTNTTKKSEFPDMSFGNSRITKSILMLIRIIFGCSTETEHTTTNGMS